METESLPSTTLGTPLLPHGCDSLVHSVSDRTRHLADKIDKHISCYDTEYAALHQRVDDYGGEVDQHTKAFRKLLKTLPGQRSELDNIQKHVDDLEATVQRLSASFGNSRTRDCVVVKDLGLELAASKQDIATIKTQTHSYLSDLRHSVSVMANVQRTHEQLIATVINGQTDCQVQLAALVTALPKITQDLTTVWNSTQVLQAQNGGDSPNNRTLAAEFEGIVSGSRPPSPLCDSQTFTTVSDHGSLEVTPLIFDSAPTIGSSAEDRGGAILLGEASSISPKLKPYRRTVPLTIESSASTPVSQAQNGNGSLNNGTLAAEFGGIMSTSHPPSPSYDSPTFTNGNDYDSPEVTPLILDSAPTTGSTDEDCSGAILLKEGNVVALKLPPFQGTDPLTKEPSASAPTPPSPPTSSSQRPLIKLQTFLNNPKSNIATYTPYTIQALVACIIFGTFLFAYVLRAAPGSFTTGTASTRVPPVFPSDAQPFQVKLSNHRAPPVGW